MALTKIENGKTIELTLEEERQLLAEWEKNEKISLEKMNYYTNLRKYPSINEQLDILYHQGYEGWKKVIKDIKDKHPKPEGDKE